MPDRLEHALAALEVEWPATPDLATAIEARLAPAPAAAAPRRSRRWPRLQLAWVAAALAVLVAAGLAASPSARSALLDLLGLRGARVERREPPPHPTATPGRLGDGLRLGRAVTLAEARAQRAFTLTVPPSLGTPDAVWLDVGPPRVSLVYDRRPGIPRAPHTNVAVLVTQFKAQATPVLQKALGTGARIETLNVAHARVFRITGEPHGFAWMTPDGTVGFDERRLAGATVLIERADGILLRFEGELPRARAIALARELAGG
jgi:hypothetical protein